MSTILCIPPSYFFFLFNLSWAPFTQDTEGSEWKESELPSDAEAVSLKDLAYGSDYQLEVKAVNANGSSLPAKFNFTIAEQPGMTTFYYIIFSECI